MTEITLGDVKIFVLSLIDLFNRKLIGFQVGYRSDATLIEATTRQAMENQQLKDLVQVTLHTD